MSWTLEEEEALIQKHEGSLVAEHGEALPAAIRRSVAKTLALHTLHAHATRDALHASVLDGRELRRALGSRTPSSSSPPSPPSPNAWTQLDDETQVLAVPGGRLVRTRWTEYHYASKTLGGKGSPTGITEGTHPPVFVPDPVPGTPSPATALDDCETTPPTSFRLWPLAHWACEALHTRRGAASSYVRKDGARLSLHMDLAPKGVPRNRDGDPKGHTPHWIVQFPHGPGGNSIGYLPATLSILDALAEVDRQWPLAVRP